MFTAIKNKANELTNKKAKTVYLVNILFLLPEKRSMKKDVLADGFLS
jgi:hypothetical protein